MDSLFHEGHFRATSDLIRQQPEYKAIMLRKANSSGISNPLSFGGSAKPTRDPLRGTFQSDLLQSRQAFINYLGSGSKSRNAMLHDNKESTSLTGLTPYSSSDQSDIGSSNGSVIFRREEDMGLGRINKHKKRHFSFPDRASTKKNDADTKPSRNKAKAILICQKVRKKTTSKSVRLQEPVCIDAEVGQLIAENNDDTVNGVNSIRYARDASIQVEDIYSHNKNWTRNSHLTKHSRSPYKRSKTQMTDIAECRVTETDFSDQTAQCSNKSFDNSKNTSQNTHGTLQQLPPAASNVPQTDQMDITNGEPFEKPCSDTIIESEPCHVCETKTPCQRSNLENKTKRTTQVAGITIPTKSTATGHQSNQSLSTPSTKQPRPHTSHGESATSGYDAKLEKSAVYLHSRSQTFTRASQYMKSHRRGLSLLNVHYSQTNTGHNDRIIFEDLLKSAHISNAVIGESVFTMERRLYNRRKDPLRCTTFYDRFMNTSAHPVKRFRSKSFCEDNSQKRSTEEPAHTFSGRTVADKKKARKERIQYKKEFMEMGYTPRSASLKAPTSKDIDDMLESCRYLRIQPSRQQWLYSSEDVPEVDKDPLEVQPDLSCGLSEEIL